MASRAPKQWCRTKHETINSFENWHQNLQYTLSLDANFTPFMIDGSSWGKKSKGSPLCGFKDDADPEKANSHTAPQKVTQLELILGQIASYCPVISRNTIVKNSTSFNDIWQAIRLPFGFQSSGSHFLDLSDIKLEADECHDDLYQRLVAFIEDNMLEANGISHHGTQLTDDDEMTPTVENIIVLMWLKPIHPELRRLVKQRYGTELRSQTLVSIKPEILQAMDSLLDELHSVEDARVMWAAAASNKRDSGPRASMSQPAGNKSCPPC